MYALRLDAGVPKSLVDDDRALRLEHVEDRLLVGDEDRMQVSYLLAARREGRNGCAETLRGGTL